MTRPAAKLLTRSVNPGGVLRLRVTDLGSGVDPSSISASIDGIATRGTYSRKKNRVTITTGALARGTHRLTFQVSD